MVLPFKEFIEVLDRTPLISIDLLIQNSDKKFLLGLRKNRPSQDKWFVPGSRIKKGIHFQDAFIDLLRVELGDEYKHIQSEFLGVYEHYYFDNVGGIPGISTQYFVLAQYLQVDFVIDLNRLPMEQHNSWKFWSVEELLESDDVHEYTKGYFTSPSKTLILPHLKADFYK